MAKRAAGEGTIRKRNIKRKDGSSYTRWFAVITLQWTPDGEQKRIEGSWRKTQAEAKTDLKQLLEQLEKGQLNNTSSRNLSDYLDYWLEQRKYELRPRSIQAYTTDAKNHIKPHIGHIKLNKLSPLQVQTWQSKLLETKGEYVTRKAKACLSAALNQALKWQLISSNPLTAVASIKMPTPNISIWEPSEVKRFLKAAKDHRFYSAYYTTLNLGLRIGELRGLKWSDINNTTLHIQRSISNDAATPIFGPPKTRKGDRYLPIPDDVMYELNKRKEAQNKDKQDHNRRWQDHDLIFTTRLGTAATKNRLVEPFKKLANEVGIPQVRFHDLRHTAASLWIANGMDVATVSARLGHSDINTTLKIYTHAFRSRMEQSGMSMNELLGDDDDE